jgi:hypothetical protein
MVTNLRKAHLRECARKALENRGYSVKDLGGPGVVPGARLRISKGSKTYTVAVRTSLERKVGLVRNPDGGWMTVPSVDRVVVVTPAEDPNCAEVLGFTPAAIIKVFDKVLAARKKQNPDFSSKAPIFVALDPVKRGNKTFRGLKELSAWQRDVPLASVPSQPSAKGEPVPAFVDRVKREFAQLIGIKEENVTVEFLIKR